MLNTKLLLIVIALLASIAGYEAYRHRQEVAREQEAQQFLNRVDAYRQKEAAADKPKTKAKDVLKYRVP